MSQRTLQPGDSVPNGEPRRYLNDRGYVRLRWLVATDQYVEVYEHRLVAGMPLSMTVHHINGVKTDNRPENLIVLSRRDHALLHAALTPHTYKRKPRQPLSEYPQCSVDSCTRPAQCRNRTICSMHYKRFKRHGDPAKTTRAWGAPNPNKKPCAVEGCAALEDGNAGYCKLHATRIRRHGDHSVRLSTRGVQR